MPWHIAVNALGVMVAAGYVGYVAMAIRVPWGAIAAAVLFFAGLAVPVMWEFLRLGERFGQIGTRYLENRRREYDPPRQEVLGAEPPPVRPKARSPKPLIVFLMVLAVCLLGADMADWFLNPPPAAKRPDSISNF